MRILITGSRDWDNDKSIYFRIMEAIGDWIESHPGLRKDQPLGWVTIVPGKCPMGADRIADIFSNRRLGHAAEVHPANWKKYGKRAGMLRNLEMVDTLPDICLAFVRNNSTGTLNCRDAAKRKGIPTETFRYEDECERFPLPSRS